MTALVETAVHVMATRSIDEAIADDGADCHDYACDWVRTLQKTIPVCSVVAAAKASIERSASMETAE